MTIAKLSSEFTTILLVVLLFVAADGGGLPEMHSQPASRTWSRRMTRFAAPRSSFSRMIEVTSREAVFSSLVREWGRLNLRGGSIGMDDGLDGNEDGSAPRGGAGEGDGGQKFIFEDSDAALRQKMDELTEGMTPEEVQKSAAETFKQIKELSPDGVFQVDVGGGNHVPLFVGEPPANYTMPQSMAWERFRAQLEGRAGDRDALGLALADAAGNGSTSECIRLIEEGANPNCHDPREWLATPLHRAARFGHETTCEMLLDMGAVCSATDLHGTTAMMGAAEFGHCEVLRLLLRAGSDPGHSNRVGNTALHKAAANDQVKAAVVLLGAGVDPDVRNEDGSTPLHLAAYFGHEGMCRELVERGATFDAKDDKDQTPAREAKIMLRRAALRYLSGLNPDDKSWDRPFTGNVYNKWDDHFKERDEFVKDIEEEGSQDVDAEDDDDNDEESKKPAPRKRSRAPASKVGGVAGREGASSKQDAASREETVDEDEQDEQDEQIEEEEEEEEEENITVKPVPRRAVQLQEDNYM